jgi:P27 family predicted phage terminase small subunit
LKNPHETAEQADSDPAEPDWLCLYQEDDEREFAASQWALITKDLRERHALSAVNGDAIARLIDFRLIYRKARDDVDRRGVMLVAKRNGTPYQNPSIGLMKGMDESIRQLESELCLAPLRRAKAGKVERKVRAPRPADVYLLRGGKR